jgi:hypothetical protein
MERRLCRVRLYLATSRHPGEMRYTAQTAGSSMLLALSLGISPYVIFGRKTAVEATSRFSTMHVTATETYH